MSGGSVYRVLQPAHIVAALILCFILLICAVLRFTFILKRTTTIHSKPAKHLLVVLGSGGHTAEMLNILQQLTSLQNDFIHRTYVVSSGDNFSASKAVDFERSFQAKSRHLGQNDKSYSIVVIRRARRVHQGLMTAPFTTILCLWDCIKVICVIHPDLSTSDPVNLILTNGPGTGVCVVFAAMIVSFLGGSPSRTIFIESWARVKTLSLSGSILKPFVNRFIVQWPQLAKSKNSGVEYIGPLVT